MVKIKEAKYILSAAWKSQWPDESVPEVVLAGRSNVGKSSFINTMLQRNNLAKVSSTPGKTRTLNFYLVNQSLYFVDVPGYGYAKVSEKIQQAFGEMMETYIRERKVLKGMILLVDYRHKPTKDDVMMYEFAKYYDLPVIVVATKEDKLKRNDRNKNEALIKKTLQMDKQDTFIRFSSLSKLGVDHCWKAIEALCDLHLD